MVLVQTDRYGVRSAVFHLGDLPGFVACKAHALNFPGPFGKRADCLSHRFSDFSTLVDGIGLSITVNVSHVRVETFPRVANLITFKLISVHIVLEDKGK